MSSDDDAQANWSAYKTYDWYAGPPASSGKGPGRPVGIEKPIIDRALREGVATRLAARGLQREPAQGRPDLLLAYHLTYRNQIEYGLTKVTPTVNPHPHHPLKPTSKVKETYRFLDGSIVLQAVDPRSDAVVWQAVAERVVNERMPPSN